jgi:hypothetical protein
MVPPRSSYRVNGWAPGRVPAPADGYAVPMSESPQQDEGQVSEVVRPDPEQKDTPTSDTEHVHDTGEETGPDARTGSDHTDAPDERSEDGLPPSD